MCELFKLAKENFMQLKKHKRLTSYGVLIAILVTEFIVSLVYIWKVYLPYEMDSDTACDVLVAQMLANSGKLLFLDDWLPGIELKIMNVRTVMALFLRVIDDYRIVWILTSGIVFCIMVGVIFFFIHCCGGNKKQKLFAAVIMLQPFTFLIGRYTVLKMFYTEYYIFGFLIIGLLFQLQNIETVEKYTWKCKVVLWTASFLAGICGIRSLMVITVPAMVSWFIIHHYQKIDKKRNLIFGLSIMLTVCGYLVCRCIVERKYPGSSIGGGIRVQSREVILENLKSSLGVILSGIHLNAGQSTLLKVALVLFYITMTICIIYRLLKRDKWFISLLIHSIVTSFVTFMSMLLLLNNFSFRDGARYISLALFLWIPCFVLSIPPVKENNKRTHMVIFNAILLLITTLTLNLIKINDDSKRNPREEYIAFLINNGYMFGNATWWNAYITDFYSEGRLETHPVSNVLSLTSLWTLVKPSNAVRTPEFLLLTLEENQVRIENGYDDNVVYEDEYYVIIDL